MGTLLKKLRGKHKGSMQYFILPEVRGAQEMENVSDWSLDLILGFQFQTIFIDSVRRKQCHAIFCNASRVHARERVHVGGYTPAPPVDEIREGPCGAGKAIY